MIIYSWLIIVLWLVLIAYWLISARGVKRTIGGRRLWREIGLRLAVLALVLLALRVALFSDAMRNLRPYAANRSPLMGIIGVLICALGVILAISARAYLGRNWGMPMSRKENPELVTNGPYAFVRHPIYTGIFLAMVGSAIAHSLFWLVPLVVWGAYFIYSARQEEELMLNEFPDQYPAYMKRTKMLLPFVL